VDQISVEVVSVGCKIRNRHEGQAGLWNGSELDSSNSRMPSWTRVERGASSRVDCAGAEGEG
jgi:hypothetical protein